MYYLNSRYYDPEIGRFINADDVSILNQTKDLFNGVNLFAYCCNNPVNYFDPSGALFLSLLFAFLGLITISGAIAGGVIADKNGKSGWNLVKDIALGAALGLATGGALISATSVLLGAIGITTVFGVSVSQIFAIGALSFDFTAFVVAPLFGYKMEGIELDKNNNSHINYLSSLKNFNIKLKQNKFNIVRNKNNDNILRQLIKLLYKLHY